MSGRSFWGISAARLSGFLTVLMVITLVGLSAVSYAEEISYTGDGNNLQTLPMWFPGRSSRSLFPGTTDAALSSDNKIIINYKPKALGVPHPEFIIGGLSFTENVENNSVVLLSGKSNNDIYGGYSFDGRLMNNSVTVSDGFVTEGGIAGGFSCKDGGAFGNTVTISGGTVEYGVFGGYSYQGDAAGNIVNLSGGSVTGGIYGGFCATGEGNSTDNTVTISGRPDITKGYILGGYPQDAPGNAFSGNSLNLKSSGISAVGVGNFEYYDFDLPKDLAAGGVMLSVTDEVRLSKTIVGISLQDDAKPRQGDKIALIRSEASVSGSPKNESCQARRDGALYEFSIYTDKNNLWAEVTKISNAKK